MYIQVPRLPWYIIFQCCHYPRLAVSLRSSSRQRMADVVGPELISDAGHYMGRHGKHLRYTLVSVRPPGGQTCQKTLASFWASELNQLSLDSVYASTAEQCFFKNLCGRHYSKQSPKSLLHNFQRRGGTSLDCKACQVYNQDRHSVRPSQYESAAYAAVFTVLDQVQTESQPLLIDHKLLKADYSAVDIYLPSIDLCIMVDGEGHFSKHHGISAQKQEEIDLKFNSEALRCGHKVLRLHYEDAGIYAEIVRVAVGRCRSGVFGRIDFSKSYGSLIRQAWGLGPLV